mgnify:CR=1 FL=1
MEFNHKLSLLSFCIFWVTYLYILTKIGLRHFKYYDVYKLLMPIYLYLYLKNKLNVYRLAIIAINIAAMIIWVFNVTI